jgi:ubiquinone/menaquinone biosynthesis C-methylase UbiE
MDAKGHWERVYTTKKNDEVSWYQPKAELSLALIKQAAPDPSSVIIDVGGGASTLVDGLLASGYRNITVLDLSGAALSVARSRLGPAAQNVRWIEANILDATFPLHQYDVWHDRAVFHFLTDPADRARYVAQARRAIKPGGVIIVASFGPGGPARCSGLDVMRYSPDEMQAQFGDDFTLLESVREDHHTPRGAVQAFVYCVFRAVN